VSGEGFPLPDIHRLRGEVAIRVNDPVAAEKHFCRAIEVARQQNSLSLELRATISFVRFLMSVSRASKGREMLASLLNQFAEGQDTHDVKEASVLLNSI
jgi:predicted ATPase